MSIDKTILGKRMQLTIIVEDIEGRRSYCVKRRKNEDRYLRVLPAPLLVTLAYGMRHIEQHKAVSPITNYVMFPFYDPMYIDEDKKWRLISWNQYYTNKSTHDEPEGRPYHAFHFTAEPDFVDALINQPSTP